MDLVLVFFLTKNNVTVSLLVIGMSRAVSQCEAPLEFQMFSVCPRIQTQLRESTVQEASCSGMWDIINGLDQKMIEDKVGSGVAICLQLVWIEDLIQDGIIVISSQHLLFTWQVPSILSIFYVLSHRFFMTTLLCRLHFVISILLKTKLKYREIKPLACTLNHTSAYS